MPPLAVRCTLLCSVLWLASAPAAAGPKTHVGAKVGDVASLSTGVVPPDNSAQPFQYDNSGPEFRVPEGWSFVVTDVHAVPSTSSFDPADAYLVVVTFDAPSPGSRFITLRFTGPSFRQALTTGFVVPGGATPTARSLSPSGHGVVVQMNGYFVKGSALPGNTPRF